MTTSSNEKRKPGRPKETNAAEQLGPNLVTSSPRDSLYEAEQDRNITQIAEAKELDIVNATYGAGEPYSYDRSIAVIEFYYRASSISLLEMGRHLKLIKENEDHGRFLPTLERLGIPVRTAQRMIRAAETFTGRPNIAKLNPSKLYELMTLDDKTLDALDAEGRSGDTKLDDIDKMTVSQTAAAVRKLRQDLKDQAKVNQDLLADKNRMLDELDTKLREREKRVKTWNGVVAEIGMNLTTMTGGAVMNIEHLRAQIEQIQEESSKFNLSKQEMEAIVKPFADHISNLKGYLQELEHDFGLNLSVYMPAHGGDFIEHSED